jgi:hypothetical protein
MEDKVMTVLADLGIERTYKHRPPSASSDVAVDSFDHPTYQFDEPYKVKSINFLKWDFHITNGKQHLFIETNGRHHYEAVRFSKKQTHENANENLLKQKRHDKLKNDFVFKHDHEILWIHYKDAQRIPELVIPFITEHLNSGLSRLTNETLFDFRLRVNKNKQQKQASSSSLDNVSYAHRELWTCVFHLSNLRFV